jgi:purine-binding chemotaxis protein CheW
MNTSAPERQLVIFTLHGESYGLPISSVREIIRYVQPSVTAAATGLVRGMINLRGRLLPIVDLSGRLGRELEVGGQTRILVLELAAGWLGLIVDTVDGVINVPADRIEPIPGVIGDDAIGGQVAALDDRLIMLIDAERALGAALPAPPKPAARRKPAAARTKPAAARAKPAAARTKPAPGTKPAARKPPPA